MTTITEFCSGEIQFNPNSLLVETIIRKPLKSTRIYGCLL